MIIPENISTQRDTLVESIRQYSIQQKENWRLIPSLALEADARTGYSQIYSQAYRSGYWIISLPRDRSIYSLVVDLGTGELLNALNKKPVQNTTLLELASYLFKIETPQILSELEEATKKPYTPQFDPQKMDIDRAALRLELERKFTSFYPFTR